MRTRLVFVAAGAALLTACSSDSGATPRGEESFSAPPPPSVSASAPAAAATEPDLGRPQTIATGLEVPWGMAFLPDGSALVNERDSADILQVPAGGGDPRRVYHIDAVSARSEGGLLGLAVDPDYAQNRYLYAYYTGADDNRIVRFRLTDDQPRVIFDGIDKAGIHNGGRIAFGPDGMLYAGTGDAGNGEESQDRRDVNGKILRLTRDGRPAPGNPDAGSPVWSMGHRNVQGLAWGPDGTMYGIEFGQNTWDEVNVIKPGKNYGWPEVEGRSDDSRYENPLVQWRPSEASPSGATVAGNTLYVAALRGQRLWTVPLGGGEPKAEFVERYGRLRTVEVAPDGALWLSTSNHDGKIDPKDGDDRILRFPAS
ncbi:MAG: PQQ-dependent sugar dehydrogenase [Actinoplanes sp.]